MAVDLFEEIVRAAFQAERYLTMENVCYRRYANAPDVVGVPGADRVASDIDLIALAPHLKDHGRVLAISCKGGRDGIRLPSCVDSIVQGPRAQVAGSPARTGFRELVDPSWQKAFRATVYRVTGENVFTHVTVAKRIEGDRRLWTQEPSFRELTPHLRLHDMADLLRMIQKRSAALFHNGTALKLYDLASAAAGDIFPPLSRSTPTRATPKAHPLS